MSSATKMHIGIDTSGLDRKMLRASHEVQDMNRRIVKGVSLMGVGEIKKEAPVGKSVPGDQYQSYRKGGQLRSSVTMELAADGMSAELGPTVEHARLVVKRTRPHMIRPKIKKALYWVGGPGPRKVVRHPGTKANDFMDRAKENIEERKGRIEDQEKARTIGRIMTA